MDSDMLKAFARHGAEAARRSGSAASLFELRNRFVGRLVVDRRMHSLGLVEDILVTSREKIPRQLVLRLPWRLMPPRPTVVVYPLEALLRSDEDLLQTKHKASAIRRLIDFSPEFARRGPDA